MKKNNFFLSVFIVFLASMAVGKILHGFLLGGDYAQLSSIYRSRTDAETHFPFMILAQVLLSTGLVWIYRMQNHGKKSFVRRGLRYGFAIALLYNGIYFIAYATQPLPGLFVAKQITADTIATMGLGVLIAWWHKN